MKADGTWYGTNFAGWRGRWKNIDLSSKTDIVGNFAAGVGNDAIRYDSSGGGARWDEWRDGKIPIIFGAVFTLAFVKLKCSPPAVGTISRSANPSDVENK